MKKKISKGNFFFATFGDLQNKIISQELTIVSWSNHLPLDV